MYLNKVTFISQIIENLFIMTSNPVVILTSMKNAGVKKSQSLRMKSTDLPSTKTSLFNHKHPKVADMVNSAISNLNEQGGSSLHAIKKYVAGTFHIDAKIQAPFIKKYLRTALVSGSLVQTTGKGASGSFKMSAVELQIPQMEVKRINKRKVSGLKRKRLVKLIKKDHKISKISKTSKISKITASAGPSKAVKIFGIPNTKLVAPIRIIKTGPKMTFCLKK